MFSHLPNDIVGLKNICQDVTLCWMLVNSTKHCLMTDLYKTVVKKLDAIFDKLWEN